MSWARRASPERSVTRIAVALRRKQAPAVHINAWRDLRAGTVSFGICLIERAHIRHVREFNIEFAAVVSQRKLDQFRGTDVPKTPVIRR